MVSLEQIKEIVENQTYRVTSDTFVAKKIFREITELFEKENEELHEHTAVIVDEKRQYGKFLLVVITFDHCPICNRIMVRIPRKYSGWGGQKLRDLFPYGHDNTLHAQLKRADVFFSSDIKNKDDQIICEICAEEGKATFICSLCEEERPSDQKQESFGDTPEFLCKVCYSTVSAKTWKEKWKVLYERHQYDFD